MALTKVPSNLDATVAITQSASDNSTNVATTAYVTTAIANLVDGAPSTLNTLDEIAAALNDDAALNTTLTNSIATKLPLAGGTLTGDLILKSDGGNDVINVVHSGNTVQLVTIGQSSDNSGNGVIQLKRNNGVLHSQIHSHGATYFNGGNVGIGFASGTPGRLLEVKGTSNPAIRLNNGTDIADIGLASSSGALLTGSSSGDLVIARNGSNGIAMGTNGSARLFIASTGNVGIGINNPLSPLSVQADSGAGVARFIGRAADNIASIGFYNNAQNADAYLQSNSSWIRARADGGFHFRKGNTPIVTDTDGFTINGMNLGIGTADPETGLHLYGTSNVTSGFTIEQVYGGSSKKFGFQPVYNDDRLDIWYNSNATAAITIKDGGYVGIGTTNPRYNLTVNGNNATAIGIGVDNASGSSTLDIAALGTGYANHQAAGGEVWFYSPDNINIGGATGNTNDIKFIANNNLNMIIKGVDTKVGIGIASPSQKLHVNGGIRFNPFSAGHGLNVVTNLTFNNTNVSNSCGSLYYKCFIINFYHNNGHSQVFGLANGGGGVGFDFTIIRPDTATAIHGRPIDFSFTTIGSLPNTFRVQISSGGGALTISRTSGTGSFGIQVHNIAGG